MIESIDRLIESSALDVVRRVDENADLISLYMMRFDRPNTQRSYTSDLAAFFGSPQVVLMMARQVTFTHVNHYISHLQHEGKSPATIRRRLAAVRGFYSWLVALGAVGHNPADPHLIRRVAQTRARDSVFNVLTQLQARDLLAVVDLSKESGVRDHALITTLLHCVLRRSEAAAMDFEHLRLVGEYVILDLPMTKGGADQTVKVTQPVQDAIGHVREEYGHASGPIWRSLSNNSKGDRLSDASIYKIVSFYAKQAGVLAQVGAHTLRHTGCTLAIEGGATIQQVQTHARHKNIETTMIYIHQRDRLANSAADFIDL